MAVTTPQPDAHDLQRQLVGLSAEQPIWLRVGKLIDGTSDRPLKDADVVFNAREILFAGKQPPTDLLSPGQCKPDAVWPDFTLLPCLIEAHAHLFLDGAPIDFEQRKQYLKQPDNWMLQRARDRWPAILSHGVGAIRDAGDNRGVGLALAAEARAGNEVSTTPWIDSPGAAIHHRGRYGSFMGEPIEEFDSAADCVAARVAAGADRIKLLVSGIINFKAGRVTASPQMDIAEVSAIVQAAKSYGYQTFAHASGTEGVENSIEGGVTSVEHGFFITEDQLDRMRDRNIAWVPTFAPVQLQIDFAEQLGWDAQVVDHLRRIIDAHRQMLCLGHQKGVKILAGSDAGSCGVPHGVGLLTELCHMQYAGMPPMGVLRSATGLSGKTLDFPVKVGQIAPGFRSRMILTRHDPLATVENLQKEKTVLFDGVMINSEGKTNTEGL